MEHAHVIPLDLQTAQNSLEQFKQLLEARGGPTCLNN